MTIVLGSEEECSPRTRGWSLYVTARLAPLDVLPAHAGMVPPGTAPAVPRPRAPRARGDGPVPIQIIGELAECSPRTRGWSHLVRLAVP